MSIRMGKNRKQHTGIVFITKDRRTKVYQDTVIQPKPTFFSDTEIERMNKQPGSYQYRGGDDLDT